MAYLFLFFIIYESLALYFCSLLFMPLIYCFISFDNLAKVITHKISQINKEPKLSQYGNNKCRRFYNVSRINRQNSVLLFYFYIIFFSQKFIGCQRSCVGSNNTHHQAEIRRINRVLQSSPSNTPVYVFIFYSYIHFLVTS